tara:strand:- start:5944 stop:6129 length:186 start_codon:yes stop_codon:yes gene_type:complete
MANEFVFPENGEGIRHARDRCFKLWQKEKQRSMELRKRVESLTAERDLLKRQVTLLSERYT